VALVFHSLPCSRCEQAPAKSDHAKGVNVVMDERIGRRVANVGGTRKAAENTVGIILNFLLRRGRAGGLPVPIVQLWRVEPVPGIAPSTPARGGMLNGMSHLIGATRGRGPFL